MLLRVCRRGGGGIILSFPMCFVTMVVCTVVRLVFIVDG